jgi:uncharacterized protein with HEPN domain
LRSEERSREALGHIRENILLAQAFAKGQDERGLAADTRTLCALVRCLEIISEASRRLTPAVKERHPDQPWARIAAAGNVYRHVSHDLSIADVLRIVEGRLPTLLAAVEAELARPA